MEPYKFKKLLFNDGLLNKTVDATYIIHLENNGRYNHIQKQLEEYHPTNTIYILFNKGYKKSKKKAFITNTALDLIDAFLEIFKHAKKENYNNILILEDDFIFSKKIKEIKHTNNINNIIKKIDGTNFIYSLGCIPFFQIPYDFYDFNNYISYSTGGTHAMIYSKSNRLNTLSINPNTIKDWDYFNNLYVYKIIYHIPLCYQLFPITENSKSWGKNEGTFLYLMGKILFKYFQFFNLDESVEPGTTRIYLLHRLLSTFIIIFFIYSILKLMQMANNCKIK
jgi:hypothetical protein